MNEESILRKKITILAISSRLLIITGQLFFNLLIPDHISDGFISPANRLPESFCDKALTLVVGGFLRWDAQHFLQVFAYGYVYEPSLAFFPGYPLSVYTFSKLIRFACWFLNAKSLFLISALLFNSICFVMAARTLFDLSCKKLKNTKLSFVSAVLFCLNPASIFFTAPYSESLYSFLSFSSMYYEKLSVSCTFLVLSTVVRSNGIVNLGFPLYREFSKFLSRKKTFPALFRFVVKTCVICVFSVSLFVAYQVYSYGQFCSIFHTTFPEEILQLAKENRDLLLPGTAISPMCNSSSIPYFYIQNRYWNVGFLEYFQFKEIPNFLIALPVISFSTFHSIKYYWQNKSLSLTLGLGSKHKNSYFEYVVHLDVLLMFCIFFVHIQVTNRLLCSSSPALYWLAASFIYKKNSKNICSSLKNLFYSSTNSQAIFSFCLLYIVLGTALFCNFLPWT